MMDSDGLRLRFRYPSRWEAADRKPRLAADTLEGVVADTLEGVADTLEGVVGGLEGVADNLEPVADNLVPVAAAEDETLPRMAHLLSPRVPLLYYS